MNITENKFANKVLAILTIIFLTLSDFLFVGNSLVSYALDIVNTNNENVEFMAYFTDETGEKLKEIEQNIDKETKLNIDVSVKQEGYFNGKLVLSDANFVFKLGQENEYISSVTEDTVTLNQVNAGSTLSLELIIMPKVSSKITESILSTETKVQIQGDYVNSKNVETNYRAEISGIDVVHVHWKSSDETKVELEARPITNNVYHENEEEKRIVQILVTSCITGNNYPVKNNYIVISVPENVQNVKVHTRSTNGTNSDIQFNESNYQYDEQNKTLKIKIANTDINNICWNKDAKDTFVVTYTLDKEEELQNKEIRVANLINTYDDKNLTAKQNVIIENEIDGIVSYVPKSTEEIYKGKIYTGEDREYSVKGSVNIDYLNILGKIEINEEQATFIKNEEERNSNIVYKATKISKDEFIKLFGEDGYITIKDDKGAIIANINKNTETDENGKILINYTNLAKSVNMVTSKPVALGTLNIENTKVILESGYERAEVDGFSAIKEKMTINQTEVEDLIVLKDTVSQAEIKINPTVILASEESEQVEIEATLLANDETKDLYKNPKVTFILPKGLTIESAKFATLYRNGLEVESGKTGKNENGQDYIEINFTGEQLKYDYLGGTVIRIKAKLKSNSEIENKTDAIQMIYTNENKNETNQVQAEIAIEEETKVTDENTIQVNNEEIPELLTSSQMLRAPRLGANASISSNETEEKINVSISAVSGNKVLEENEDVYEGQTIKYQITVTNNTGKDYENVEIKAKQKNGYVWDLYEEKIVNHYLGEDEITEHFYEITDSNNIRLANIETLKNGESYTYTYDATTYLINAENIDGNQTYGTVSIVSGDNTINETYETVKNNIREAELKVDLLEGSSREAKWYSEKTIKSEVNIKNLTNSTQKNVKLKIVLIKNLNVGNQDNLNNMFLFNGFADRITIDGISTNSSGQSVVTLNISSIEAQEEITIGVSPNSGEINQSEDYVEMFVQAITSSGVIYNSGELIRTIYNSAHNFEVKQKFEYTNGTSLDYENDKIENGEEIKITGTIVNKEEKRLFPYIKYKLDNALEVQSANLILGNEQTDITEEFNSNELNKDGIILESNETLKILIIAKVNTSKTTENTLDVILDVSNLETNKNKSSTVTLSMDKEEPETQEKPKEGETQIIDDPEGESGIKIINPKKDRVDDEDESENEGNNEENNDNKKDEDEDNTKDDNKEKDNSVDTKDDIKNTTTYTISGTAWIDKNKDGKKQSSEEKVASMTVGVINSFTGELISTTKTNANGAYTLNVIQGDYIVVFYYNDEIYTLTSYQAEGTQNSENSNAIAKAIVINNESVLIGATDTLKVTSNLTDINIGLVNRNKFELKVEKYVSKVVVSNSAGSKTYEQKDNTTLAKVEIKAKNLQNSLVVIEYKIKVTNTGDIEGYAKNIVDYLPTGLNFNSTLNSDWYKSGDYLYNTSLANTKIKPGETKEITLVATKTMTESNTGLINNKAEINSATNSLGLENESRDKASADVIISVSTGALIGYVSCTVLIFGMTILIAYLINKKRIYIE